MIRKHGVRAGVRWTNEKEDELVELWQERPYLYLISSPEYADQVKKSIAVKEIADVLSLNVIANLSAGWIDFLMFVSCFFMDGFM